MTRYARSVSLLALVAVPTLARAACAPEALLLPPEAPLTIVDGGNAGVVTTAARVAEQGRATMRRLDNGDFDDPAFAPVTVKATPREEGDDVRSFLTFTTGSGRKLTVAATQLLPDSFGRLKPASDFKLGSSLVKPDGTFALIKTRESKPYYGPLVEIAADGTNAAGPTVVESQGFLVALGACAKGR